MVKYHTFPGSFRLIKEFDREMKDEDVNINPESSKLLNEKKQSLVCERISDD